MKQYLKKAVLVVLLPLAFCKTIKANAGPGLNELKDSLPNIIIILADDLGIGDIGVYGQTRILTPNIDRLAAEGIRFTQFYSGTSVCAPSRSSLLTGQHTGHTPIRGNKEVKPEGQWPLPGNAFTIGELLKKAGYRTGAFGKWGLGFVGTSGDPLRQGFDRFYGYNCQRQAHNYFPEHLWDNDSKILLDNNREVQQNYAPDLIQEQAIKFITASKDKPFFAYLAYTLPHAALQLPDGDKHLDKYIKQFNEKPISISDKWDGKGFYPPQAYPHAAYAAMVSRLDDYVGELSEKLKQLGIEQNTMIIFTSDNGPHQEGGNDPDFFNSSAGLRGKKRELYEGGIRVPMIVKWPSIIRPGRMSANLSAAWDMLPTLADVLGENLSSDSIDGISLLPTLKDQGNQTPHQYLYWEFHENGGIQALRKGMYKAVIFLNNKNDLSHPKVELFDLAKDPYEQVNIAVKRRVLFKKMQRLIDKNHTANPDFPLTAWEKK